MRNSQISMSNLFRGQVARSRFSKFWEQTTQVRKVSDANLSENEFAVGDECVRVVNQFCILRTTPLPDKTQWNINVPGIYRTYSECRTFFPWRFIDDEVCGRRVARRGQITWEKVSWWQHSRVGKVFFGKHKHILGNEAYLNKQNKTQAAFANCKNIFKHK